MIMNRSAPMFFLFLLLLFGCGSDSAVSDRGKAECFLNYTFVNKSNSAEYEKEVAEAVKSIKESCASQSYKSDFYELANVHLKYGNKSDAEKVIKMLLDSKTNIQDSDFVRSFKPGRYNNMSYPKVANFLRSREFLNSETGKFYTEKLREVEKRRKEAIAKIAKSQRDYRPSENVVIKKGACPGDCCSYESARWEVVDDINLFDMPNGKKIVGRISKGTPVIALTGDVYVTPVPVMVAMDGEVYVSNASGEGEICNKHGAEIRDGEWLKLKTGEVYYILDYIYDGSYNFWYRGCEYTAALDVEERCLFPGEFFCSIEYVYPEKRDNMVRWIKIKVNDGKQPIEGWSREVAYFFDEQHDCL